MAGEDDAHGADQNVGRRGRESSVDVFSCKHKHEEDRASGVSSASKVRVRDYYYYWSLSSSHLPCMLQDGTGTVGSPTAQNNRSTRNREQEQKQEHATGRIQDVMMIQPLFYNHIKVHCLFYVHQSNLPSASPSSYASLLYSKIIWRVRR